jgi:hypothetical protein
MTDPETYLAALDRALRWRPRAEQMRRLDAELALWIPKLSADTTGTAATIVGGLTGRRRELMARVEKAARHRAAQERRAAQARVASL